MWNETNVLAYAKKGKKKELMTRKTSKFYCSATPYGKHLKNS